MASLVYERENCGAVAYRSVHSTLDRAGRVQVTFCCVVGRHSIVDNILQLDLDYL